MAVQQQDEHSLGFRVLILVWALLMILTVITVRVSRLDLGPINIWAALGIASVKASLVLAFFMHLKNEGLLLKLFFLGTLATLATFIGMTFFDVLYR